MQKHTDEPAAGSDKEKSSNGNTASSHDEADKKTAIGDLEYDKTAKGDTSEHDHSNNSDAHIIM